MNRTDRRLVMTLRLECAENTLLRSVDTIEPPRLAPPPMERFPLPPQLDTIRRTLDAGTPEDIAQLMTTEAAMLGAVLFETLFVSETEFAALLRDLTGDTQPDPRYRPLRVRIVTADSLLAGLPYHFTSYQGKRLTTFGCTFEVTHPAALGPPPLRTWNRSFVESSGTAAPERLPSPMLSRPAPTALRDVRFPARPGPARVLMVAPEVLPTATPLPDFNPRYQTQKLRDKLAALGYAADDPTHMRIVHTAQDFCRSLAGMSPDVVFVAAYADETSLWLEARDGSPLSCRIADISPWLQAHPPLMLAIAGCPLNACAFASQFEKLAPWAASTILYRAGSWNEDEAMDAMLDAMQRMLGSAGDPIQALHAQMLPATLTVHGAYARWVSDEPTKPVSKSSLILRNALAPARETILDEVTALCRNPDARVLALIVRAPSQSLGMQGTRPLLDELDITGRHLGRLKVITMPAEEAEQDSDLQAEFKRSLLLGLDIGSGTIEETLLRAALDSGWSPITGTRAERGPEKWPEDRATIADRSGERGLLWLDFGIRGAAPNRPFTMEELEAFVEITAEVLGLHTPANVRVICAITVECSSGEFQQIEEMVAEQKTQLPVEAPIFEAMVLPMAQAFDRDGVRACFAEAYPEPCPATLLERMTDAAFAYGGGDVQETLGLVTQALTTSWTSVLRGLEESDDSGGSD